MNKRTIRQIASHLSRSLSHNERGKAHFEKSGTHIQQALQLGAPLDEPITLKDGRKFILTDEFANKNEVYRAARFPRYRLARIKDPSPLRAAEKKAAAEGRAALAESEVAA